jgi:hypothetical protein
MQSNESGEGLLVGWDNVAASVRRDAFVPGPCSPMQYWNMYGGNR